MAFSSFQTTVAELSQAAYGRVLNKDGIDHYSQLLQAGTQTEAQILAEFMSNTEASIRYPATSSDADTVTQVFENVLGRAPAQTGVDFYAALLADGTYVKDTLVAAILADAKGLGGGDATYINEQVAIGEAAYEAEAATEEPTVDGSTIRLTSGTDRDGDFDGTANNDQFNAYIEQNSFAGGVSNSLSSADHLNGGAGADSLYAELTMEFVGVDGGNEIDIQPRTTSIETIEIEARDAGGNADANITVDAKYMWGVDKIGSKNSDGDLTIENLTTLDDDGVVSNMRHISDMTITMDHTDNHNSDNDASDLTVLFDEDYLNTSSQNEGATLTINMINTLNLELNNGSSFIEGFETVTFSVGTDPITVDVAGKELSEIKGLLEAAVSAYPGIKVEEYTEDAYFGTNVYYETTDTTYAAGQYVGKYDAFRLTNSGSEALTEGGFTFTEGQRDGSISWSQDDNESVPVTLPIEIAVELDKVGRDGEGGDLIIGGKDLDIDGDSDADTNDGIDIFNITVEGGTDRPSNLGIIQSTNAELDTVNIVSETRTDNSYAALDVTGNAHANDNGIAGGGAAYDNTTATAPFGGDLAMLEADSFMGNLEIGTEAPALNIDNIDAAGGGNVTLVHNTTVNGSFTTDTGSGSDTITTDIDMSDSAIHTYSNTINTGSNADTVNLTYSTQTATNYVNTVQIDQVDINTGADSDTVTIGAGDGVFSTADVDLGSGSDTIFISNDAAKAQWVFNADASGTSFVGRGDVAHKVFKMKLAVEFEGITTDFVEVEYSTSAYTTSATAINDAVKAAIAGDAEMAKLLTTTDLRDNGLQVTSLVDRALQVDDLNVVFLAPKYAGHNNEAAGDDTTVLEQDDSTLYQNDSADIFAARTSVSATEMGEAHNAWFTGSTGVDGDDTSDDVSLSVDGDPIYDNDENGDEEGLFNSMFRAIDSDDVNSSSQSGEINADPADDDNDNGADLTGGTAVDQNMDYSATIGYNKQLTATGANNTEISTTQITGGTGDDLIVLNSNNAANSGYETLVLTAGFGTDTVLNFHTAGATATADVIDYSAFLDTAAAARAESADAKEKRVDQKVGMEFINLVDNENANSEADNGAGDNNEITAGAGLTGQIDHNTVITVELSDLFDELQTTGAGGETVSTYADITDSMMERALNAVIVDGDFQTTDDNASTAVGNNTEDDLVGSKVVFNVVYDRQIEQSAAASTTEYVMGDDTDYHTVAVYSATVAHDGTDDSTGDLTLDAVTKQGTLDFGDMYSSFADVTDASMGGTPAQATAAKTDLANNSGVAVAVAPTITLGGQATSGTIAETATPGSIIFSISGTEGESYAYTLAGTGIEAADFTGTTALSGSVTVGDTLRFLTAADESTDEGDETATLTLTGGGFTVSESVTITDDSVATTGGQTAVVVTDADADTASTPNSIDASTADNLYTFTNTGSDTFKFTGFASGDTLDVDDTLTQTVGTYAGGIQVGFYDATDFDPVTIVNLETSDAALIAAVDAAADTTAKIAAVTAEWGDWLI